MDKYLRDYGNVDQSFMQGKNVMVARIRSTIFVSTETLVDYHKGYYEWKPVELFELKNATDAKRYV